MDALFLVGVRAREELEAVAAAVKLPLILGGAGPALMDLDYLSAKGVRICLQGHQPFLAAVRAVHETLKALRDGTLPAQITGTAAPELMRRATREEAYRRWMQDFLGGR